MPSLHYLLGNTADAFTLKDLLTKSKNFQVILHSFCFNLKTSCLFCGTTETPVFRLLVAWSVQMC